jgi:glycosyltransferase involved in cell wall biosynthesis
MPVASGRLNFCMATTFYPPYSFGGDGLHVYRLSNELARRGHRVTVVHSVDAYRIFERRRPNGSFPNEPGVTVRAVESRAGPLAPLTTYLTGRAGLYASVLDDVFRERFDVVHFHNISLLGGPRLLSYGDGVKLYTLNEHWLVCPMHVLLKHNREPCEEPQCLSCTVTFRRPPQLWRYTGLLERELGNVDLFLSPSQFTIDAHRVRGFDRPMRRLPHFLPRVDSESAHAATHGRNGRPYFLYVGRLEKLKGVQTLVERFRVFRGADLLVAGDGGYAGELRRQAAGLDHVRFLGPLHPSALPPLYAGAIALVVPTIAFEAFGIVVLEAFAQRTPVIVRDLGALPEPVRESGGGLVYRSEEELGEAMERLQGDSELRAELGARGHAAWLERWSEQPHVDGYFAAIDEARALAGG